MIVRVNVVLNRTQLLLTMTGVLATYAVVIFRVKVRCITLVDGFKLWSLIWLVNWVAMLLVVYSNRVVIGINEDYHQLTWYKSLWLWRWLPHSLSKCQSLSTTVLFRSLFFLRLFILWPCFHCRVFCEQITKCVKIRHLSLLVYHYGILENYKLEEFCQQKSLPYCLAIRK